MTFVSELSPTPLWKYFDRVLAIPRASKNEDQMRQFIVSLADKLGLQYKTDDAGNLVVYKAGTDGHQEAPTTILQSHLDMVQEKNADIDFDFSTDAIIPVREGEYLTAKGTTLGSDNGIGVAAMLAVMATTQMAHGPLEFLFTIDEETGLTGAAQLDASLLTGRQLINLDSEEENILYVGCAGGGDSQIKMNADTKPCPSDARTLRISLTGLKGGHSGCDIHLQRGNAICLLARMLLATNLVTPFRLTSLSGGSAHNAIPREAFATVVITSSEERDTVVDGISQEFSAIQSAFRPVESSMTLKIEDVEQPKEHWDIETTANVLRLLNGLPHGVDAMNYDIPELVETSNNVATVGHSDGELLITTSTRSSNDADLDALRRRIRAIGELAGATVQEGAAYPGWKPNLQSHLLEVVKTIHKKELGEDPSVKAIHAGLECGILGKKIQGMDMISFGPIIEFPHSPDEQVHIDSVGRFYRLLASTLEALTQMRDR